LGSFLPLVLTESKLLKKTNLIYFQDLEIFLLVFITFFSGCLACCFQLIFLLFSVDLHVCICFFALFLLLKLKLKLKQIQLNGMIIFSLIFQLHDQRQTVDFI